MLKKLLAIICVVAVGLGGSALAATIDVTNTTTNTTIWTGSDANHNNASTGVNYAQGVVNDTIYGAAFGSRSGVNTGSITATPFATGQTVIVDAANAAGALNTGIFGNVFGGLGLTSTAVTGNQVTVKDVAIAASAAGAAAAGNFWFDTGLTLSGANTLGGVFGGVSRNGLVDNNDVIIDGTAGANSGIADVVTGGWTGQVAGVGGKATFNTVTVKSTYGGTIGSHVVGGSSLVNDSTDNTVELAGGVYSANAYVIGGISGGIAGLPGGAQNGKNSTDNTVKITGGNFSALTGATGVYGGLAVGPASSGITKDNRVEITGLTAATAFNGHVVGGQAHRSNSESNDVEINFSTAVAPPQFNSYIIGGESGTAGVAGDAKENTVKLNNINSSSFVTGGSVLGTGKAIGNDVFLVNTQSGEVRGGRATAGAGTGAIDNAVEITGTRSTVTNVWGGITATGNADLNEVVIGSFDATTGSYTGIAATGVTGNLIGGQTNAAAGTNLSASSNIVAAYDSLIVGNVFGGSASFSNGVADDNTITIVGQADAAVSKAQVRGNVIGGISNTGAAASADGNKVNIEGAIAFTAAGSNIYGGSIDGGTNAVLAAGWAGNTLNTNNLGNATNGNTYTVNNIGGFENYDFTTDDRSTVASLSQAGNVDGAIYVNTQGGNFLEVAGTNGDVYINGDIATTDTYRFFDRAQNTGNTADWEAHSDMYDLSDTQFNLSTGTASVDWQLSMANARVAARTQAWGQSMLAGMQLINTASDFMHDIPDLYNVAYATRGDACNPCDTGFGSRPLLFAGIKGGHEKLDVNNDAENNLKYLDLLVGAGWRNENFLIAPFFEAGWGKYDAEFNGYKHFDDNKTSYIGGGLLIRGDFQGFYAQASFHAGKLKNDMYGDFYTGSANKWFGARHDYSGTYFGIGAEIGKSFVFCNNVLDLSARYDFNRTNSDDFLAWGYESDGTTIRNLTGMSMDSVHSHRIRVGGEYSYNGGVFKPYVGAYYEHEFAANADGKFSYKNVYNLSEAKASGSTGIGRLGVRFGGLDNKFSADIGIEGYVGRRQGIAGKALFGVAF